MKTKKIKGLEKAERFQKGPKSSKRISNKKKIQKRPKNNFKKKFKGAQKVQK